MTERIDPAAAMLALQISLSNGELPPAAVRTWFCNATSAWLNGLDIATAMGLRPAAASFAIRDNWIRTAAGYCDNCPKRLADAIARHPRHRASNDPVHAALDAAKATGRRLPASPKHLARIIRKAA